ncbi:site-2 protease family protein [Futiania mangrovi]|uniref:Zinc metalloprotease n=1 Tax=Futiania mangrovi TaxID=2959716 RepID=A0A9J6PHS5_9PROT|nr:site-2 protease family protein [Futiania mangrovii]MCP1337368.1 site-2 protease family protein [Futiania mangrovii]
MFTHRLSLFRILGFEVRIDLSWLLIAALVTWSLAAGYFPTSLPGLDTRTYWTLGILGMAGLFLSLIIHEFSHSIVARMGGMKIEGITLFLFGGVAEMKDEPPSALTELVMAAAGPAASLVLAFLFWAVAAITGPGLIGEPGAALLLYLATINLVLALFNLVPAFPLDGGRMLRAWLWMRSGDIRKATRVAAGIGDAFGVFLVVVGIFNAFTGNVIGGLWLVLIGFFVRAAAAGAHQNVEMKTALSAGTVADFMTPDPVTVEAGLTLDTLVDRHILGQHHGAFPVLRDGRLVGLVESRQAGAVAREEWPRTRVADVMAPVTAENSAAPGDGAWEALQKMQTTRARRLLVVDQGRLMGLVSLSDIARYLMLKAEVGDSA